MSKKQVVDRPIMCKGVFIFFAIALLPGCFNNDSVTIKDLDQTMFDVRAYQENLGDQIKAGRLHDADWLLEGLDSIFGEIKKKFTQHRKLEEPFSYYYKTKMKTPISLIRQSIRENDTSLAMKGYRMLVNKCNSCHTDNDIDRDVNF